MKKAIWNIFFGRSPLLSGLIALAVMGSIVLGCTCNDKNGFSWNSSGNDSETVTKDTDEDVPEKPVTKADASKGEIPEEAELAKMVETTLMDFDAALKKEDFSDFYEGISETWKKQTTPRQLKKLFESFIEGKANVGSIQGLEPKFTKTPAIRESSGFEMLEVDGEYATSPNPTSFELKYIAEGEDWKLAGIFVRTTLYSQP